MSVINQMLKDLDQRSPEPNTNTAQPNNTVTAHAPMKTIVITTVCVLIVCMITFFVWQLINENNALKAQQLSIVNQEVLNQTVATKPVVIANAVKIEEVQKAVYQEAVPQVTENTALAKQAVKIEQLAQIQEGGNVEKLAAQPSQTQLVAVTERVAIRETVVENSTSKVTPANKPKTINKQPQPLAVKSQVPTAPKTNKISVSRRQLSADELAQQKFALAEKALENKQVSKAEKLLEDVLIIKPSDSQARKKLAALWFGRQAYQDATNLLSQGIALDTKDSSLREMKARIHLKQGQTIAALNTLKPLADLKDKQYQIMLANTAQQAQQNKYAINAYKVLITMQPHMGRWQLALAVLYDKNSQFTLASKAYQQALERKNLSISSEAFAKQRIQAIGQ